MFGLIEMGVFLTLLVIGGFVYVWKRGAPGVGMSNIVQNVLEAASNPLPEGRLDGISPDGDNPLLQNGYVTTSLDALWNWARTGSMWPMTFGRPAARWR